MAASVNKDRPVKKPVKIDDARARLFATFVEEGWSLGVACKKAGFYPKAHLIAKLRKHPISAPAIEAYYERVLHPTRIKNLRAKQEADYGPLPQ